MESKPLERFQSLKAGAGLLAAVSCSTAGCSPGCGKVSSGPLSLSVISAGCGRASRFASQWGGVSRGVASTIADVWRLLSQPGTAGLNDVAASDEVCRRSSQAGTSTFTSVPAGSVGLCSSNQVEKSWVISLSQSEAVSGGGASPAEDSNQSGSLAAAGEGS